MGGINMERITELLRNTFELSLLQEIIQVGSTKLFKAGEQIISPGQTVRFIPILLSGTLKISRANLKEEEIFLYYLQEGQTCSMTFTCCMQRKKSEVTALCIEDSELLIIPLEYMDKWMNQYPTWKSFVMNTIQERFDELLLAVDEIAFNNLDDRILAYLKKHKELLNKNVLEVSHAEIAKDLATSRVVISRLLKKLESKGVIQLGRNQIRIM